MLCNLGSMEILLITLLMFGIVSYLHHWHLKKKLICNDRSSKSEECFFHMHSLNGENEEIQYGIAYTECGWQGGGFRVSKRPTVHPKSAFFDIHADNCETLLKLKDLVMETKEYKQGYVRNAFSKAYTKMDEILSEEYGEDCTWLTASRSTLAVFRFPLAHVAAGFPIDCLAIRSVAGNKIFKIVGMKDVRDEFIKYRMCLLPWNREKNPEALKSVNMTDWVPGCANCYGLHLDKEQYMMFKPRDIGCKWTDEFICEKIKKAQEKGWTLGKLCEEFLLSVDLRHESNMHTALCIVRVKRNTVDHKWPWMGFSSWLRLKLAGLGFPVSLSCHEIKTVDP